MPAAPATIQHERHVKHLHHLAHLAHLRFLAEVAQQIQSQPRWTPSPVANPAPAIPVSGGNPVAGTVPEPAVSDTAGIPAWASCIVGRESGGNPTAQNPTSTASGLFQDLASTWNGYQGYPSAASAPVSVQIAFNNALEASSGLSPWQADGCPGT